MRIRSLRKLGVAGMGMVGYIVGVVTPVMVRGIRVPGYGFRVFSKGPVYYAVDDNQADV